MALALRPSIPLADKTNVNPSINRQTEVTAEDFEELAFILNSYADRFDAQLQPELFYFFHSSLAVLQATYPNAEEDGWAVIVPTNGNQQFIATFSAGVWTATAVVAPIQLFNTKLDRPDPGAEGIFYVVKDEKILSLWYDGAYHPFGKDGNNGISAYEVAVAFGFVGTEPEWIANLEGKDNYQLWLDAGNVGTYNDFFEASRGPEGVEGPAAPVYDDTQIRTDFADADALKVDKVAGKGLSDENYTLSEKNKLTSIDAAHYGQPLQSTIELSAILEANASDKERRYVEDDLSDYFYDVTAVAGDIAPDDQTGGTGFWRKVAVGGETAASVKAKYESNADTNAFTDALLAKINSITAIFTAALKTAYDTASSWVSTNGANVLAHVTKFTVPLVLGKIPVSQADGSIVWEPKPTGGADLSGDLNFPAYPNTRNDGQIPMNRVLSTDASGNLKMYSIATAPAPFLNIVIPDSTLPNTTGNFKLKGAFFTPTMTVVFEGQIVNYFTFISDNEIDVNVTTGATEGNFDITLNNGLSAIFPNTFLIVLGTVYTPATNEWTLTEPVNVDKGDILVQTFGLEGKAEWSKVFDYTIDWSLRFMVKSTPLGSTYANNYTQKNIGLYNMSNVLRGYFGFYTQNANNIFMTLGNATGSPTALYPTLTDTDSIGYFNNNNDTFELRCVSRILYLYKNNVLKGNIGTLTENLKLVSTISRFDIINIKFIELA